MKNSSQGTVKVKNSFKNYPTTDLKSTTKEQLANTYIMRMLVLYFLILTGYKLTANGLDVGQFGTEI